jgi:flagellar motor switch protein FliN
MAGDSNAPDELNRLSGGTAPGQPANPGVEDALNAAAMSPGPVDPAVGGVDVEALLKQALNDNAGSSSLSSAVSSAAGPGPADPSMAQGDVEYLLRQAELALASVEDPIGLPSGVNIKPFQLKDFAGAPASKEVATLALVRDVELDVKIELGRTQMYLDDVLRLHKGSVVPLDKLAGDPVDIFVNGRLIARGEVLVLNDNFCVRVAELVAGETTV